MTILTVRHVTTYRYRRPVALGEHRMMFRPRDSYDQRLIESRLVITPEPVRIHWIHDPFGNCVAIARFKVRASELRFESTIRVDHYPDNVPDFQTDPRAKAYPFVYDSRDAGFNGFDCTGIPPIRTARSTTGCASSCFRGDRRRRESS